MKKNFQILLFFFFSTWICGAAIANDGTHKIAISLPSATSGWLAAIIEHARAEMIAQKQKHPSLEFYFLVANTPAKQLSDLKALEKIKIQALVILPVSDYAMNEKLQALKQQGVFIVAFDRISPSMPHDVIVEADNEEIGRQCAVFMADYLGGKGDVAIMEGMPSSINTARVGGFKKTMAQHPGIKVINAGNMNWRSVSALELLDKMLNRHQKLDAVWAGDDDVLLRLVDVYKNSGRQDIKLFMGLGGNKEVIKMIIDGDPLVQGTIHYPAAIVSLSIKTAVERLLQDKNQPAKIDIKTQLIDKSNASSFYDPRSSY